MVKTVAISSFRTEACDKEAQFNQAGTNILRAHNGDVGLDARTRADAVDSYIPSSAAVSAELPLRNIAARTGRWRCPMLLTHSFQLGEKWPI